MKKLDEKQINELIDTAIGMMDYSYVPYSHFHVGAALLACGDRSYASVLSAPEVKQAARYEVASYEEDGVLQVLKDILQEVAHEK